MLTVKESIKKASNEYELLYISLENFPISENSLTGIGVGASFRRKVIVEYLNFNFSLQGISHIYNCAKINFMTGQLNCNIVFKGHHGYRSGYGAEHTTELYSVYGQVPGLRVIAPFTSQDHYLLLKLAIEENNPVIYLENENLYDKVIDYNIENNSYNSYYLKRGSKCTIVGFSVALLSIMEACKDLDVDIINLVSIRPLKVDLILESIKKTKKLIIVDYSTPSFSVSNEIENMINNINNNYNIIKLNSKDSFVPYFDDNFYPSIKDIQNNI